MKRVLNLGRLSRIVEGDPNEVTSEEILVIKDPTTGQVDDIQVRGPVGDMESVMVNKAVLCIRAAFAISATPEDAVVTLNGRTKEAIAVQPGSNVSWSVSKTGFTTQQGTEVVTGDTLKRITLVAAGA